MEPPQPPQRLPQLLAHEIVQRRRQRRTGGPVLRHDLRPARLGSLDIERVTRQVRGEPPERREYRFETLAVKRRRIRFAPSLLAVAVDQPHPGAFVSVGRATGDREGMARGDGALLDVELQIHRFFLSHHMVTPDVTAMTMRAP